MSLDFFHFTATIEVEDKKYLLIDRNIDELIGGVKNE